MFELKNTSIYKAVKWEKSLLFKYRRFFKTIFGWLAFSLFLLSIFSFFSQGTFGDYFKKFLGGAVFGFALWILFLVLSAFFNGRLREQKPVYKISELLKDPKNFNLASFLDFEAAKVCDRALKIAKKRKALFFPANFLLEALFSEKNDEVSFICWRLELLPKIIASQLQKEFTIQRESQKIGKEKEKEKEKNTENIILAAAEIAQERKRAKIGVGDILIAFASADKFFQKILVNFSITAEDIRELADWFERMQKKTKKMKRFWDYDNLLRKGSLAKDWAAGYTINLDNYSTDLREEFRGGAFREFFGHNEDILAIERILEKRTVNNVLLVGAPGSGKKSIIEALAQKAFLGQTLPSIRYKRFLNFDIGALTAASPSAEQTEFLLDACFREAVSAGNVVLVIEELQNFLRQKSKVGEVNIGATLGRYLPLPDFQVIGIVNYEGLHKIIERDPAIMNLFNKVEVSEISLEDTLKVLESFVPSYERRQRKFISFKALKEIVKLTDTYMSSLAFPEKAVRILDEVMAYMSSQSAKIVRAENVAEVVSEKIKIPVGKVEFGERQKLLHLESLIHKRIIDQDEAVSGVSTALRRARSGVQERKGTIGNFLFLGPTGVGKTETSKALAQIYFGSEERMIRLDMSEFQSINDIPRLIGSETQEGLLTSPVRENPFSLILLDEIEKAHPNVLNLFLQVLDEGRLTDGLGRKINFKNAIIIATSNAGAEVIREDIEKNQELDIVKKDLLDHLLKQRIFRPEFINRFDAVVVFKPLTKENLLAIAQLMLEKIKMTLQDKGIDFVITEDLKKEIVRLSYSPAFGAREMKRVLQDKVENAFAKDILSGKIRRGDKVKVDPQNFSIVKIRE